jgi:hypothetical protein
VAVGVLSVEEVERRVLAAGCDRGVVHVVEFPIRETEPQLYVVADMAVVIDQRAHDLVVLGLQVLVGYPAEQPSRPPTRIFESPDKAILHHTLMRVYTGDGRHPVPAVKPAASGADERVECSRERREEGLVSEKERPTAERLTEAFGEPYREVVRSAVDAQQRNVQLAQGWVDSMTGLLESQAEANRALTRAMEAHTNAVEEAIKSQERTSRALAESLDAYKDVIERNTALQEKSTDLVQGFFGDMTSELRQGMQTSQDVAKTLMEGSEKQMEAFQAMLSEAMNSYTNLMNAPFDLYRKNLEALGKQGR